MLWEAQHALKTEKVSPVVCSLNAHRTATPCTCQPRHPIPKTDVRMVSCYGINMLLEAWRAVEIEMMVEACSPWPTANPDAMPQIG